MACFLSSDCLGGVQLLFNGQVVQVPATSVQRSSLLQQLLQDSASNESSTSQCPITGITQLQVVSWLRFLEESHCDGGIYTEMNGQDVAEALLVRFESHDSCKLFRNRQLSVSVPGLVAGADFLVDEEAVSELCELLSEHIVSTVCSKDATCAESQNTTLKVLQNLPLHLIESTLAAAERSSPVTLVNKFLGVLDTSLHATVMEALTPSIRAQKRLQIAASLDRASWGAKEARCAPSSLKMRIAASSFSYLTRLQLSDIKATPDAVSATCELLNALPDLASLLLTKCELNAKAGAQLIEGLTETALSSLTSLSLNRMRKVFPEDSGELWLAALVNRTTCCCQSYDVLQTSAAAPAAAAAAAASRSAAQSYRSAAAGRSAAARSAAAAAADRAAPSLNRAFARGGSPKPHIAPLSTAALTPPLLTSKAHHSNSSENSPPRTPPPPLECLTMTDTEIALPAVLPYLQQLPNLNSLDLPRSPDLLPTAAHLLKEMHDRPRLSETHTSLTSLNLANSLLTSSQIEAVAPLLRSFTNLRSLSLCGNLLDGSSMCALSRALRAMPLLATLDLSRCRFGASGMNDLSRSLQELPEMQDLILRENFLDSSIAGPLAAALRHMTRLRHLDLSCCRLLDSFCEIVSPSLQTVSTLTYLNLRGNKTSLTNLQKLCLSGDKESCKGVDLQAIAPALAQLQLLKHLDLFNYDIEEVGAKELAQSLIELRALNQLELRFADIPTESATALAQGVAWLIDLQYLDLSESRIKDEAVLELLPVVASLPQLRGFNLSCTGIQDGAARLVVDAFRSHSHMELLDMAHNKGMQVKDYGLPWVLA